LFALRSKINKKMVRIRLALEEDKKTIAQFQIEMAKETEGLKLDLEVLINGVTAVFRDPVKGKYLVAEDGKQIVGSMLLTPEWSDWRDKWILWIQSVYVMPEFRKNKIFSLMYEFAKQIAERDEEVAGMRLYVDNSNERAVQVYKAIGMDGDHYRVFEWMKNN
jgi:ribosomal protein S18 acetylase RimI-like enzyme